MLPVLLIKAYVTVLEKTTPEFRKKLRGLYLAFQSGSKYFNLDRNLNNYDKICKFLSNEKHNFIFIKGAIKRDLEYSQDCF